VTFESAYDRPLDGRGIFGVTQSFDRGLRRRRACYYILGNAAQSNTLANTGADALANSSFGLDFVVAKFFARCGKLQRLSRHNAFCRAHQDWQCHGNELCRYVCPGWPDLLLHRDRGQWRQSGEPGAIRSVCHRPFVLTVAAAKGHWLSTQYQIQELLHERVERTNRIGTGKPAAEPEF
jgi:hypothetical protein